MTRKHYLTTDIHPALVAALTSAETSIQLAVGQLLEPGLLGLLQKKALAGVNVELILFGEAVRGHDSIGGQTSPGGVKLIGAGKELKEQLIDANFRLIDRGEIIIEGDYRWLKGPAEEGRHLILSTDALTLAETYRQEFDHLRHHGEMAKDTPKAPMGLTVLVKRLEVLQALFRLEDTDFLDFRLDGLREFAHDPDIASIVAKIEEEQFDSAAEEVTDFLAHYRMALACINPPIDNLLHEIK